MNLCLRPGDRTKMWLYEGKSKQPRYSTVEMGVDGNLFAVKDADTVIPATSSFQQDSLAA